MSNDKKISELPLADTLSGTDELVMNVSGETKRGAVSALIKSSVSDDPRNALTLKDDNLFVDPLSGTDISLSIIEVLPTSAPANESVFQYINIAGYKVKAHPYSTPIKGVYFPADIPRIMPELTGISVANLQRSRVRFTTLNHELSDNLRITTSGPSSIKNLFIKKIDKHNGYIEFDTDYPASIGLAGESIGYVTIEDGLIKSTVAVRLYRSIYSMSIRKSTIVAANRIEFILSGRDADSSAEAFFVMQPIVSVNKSIAFETVLQTSGFNDTSIIRSYSSLASSTSARLYIELKEPYTGELIVTIADGISGFSNSVVLNIDYPG